MLWKARGRTDPLPPEALLSSTASSIAGAGVLHLPGDVAGEDALRVHKVGQAGKPA
jgi:hypothetical protein